MSTVVPVADPLPVVLPYRPMRFSVAEYHKLIADGTLTENHRLELLRGVLVEKMPQNPLHAAIIGILQHLLGAIFSSGFHTRSQVPITLHDSEPEPDVSVARGERADYLTRHPGPADVPLVAEIANSSLVTDRFKGEIYAEAGVPVYWIVNLAKHRVEVYSEPVTTVTPPHYARCLEFQTGELIPVIHLGKEIGLIPASDLLPTAKG